MLIANKRVEARGVIGRHSGSKVRISFCERVCFM